MSSGDMVDYRILNSASEDYINEDDSFNNIDKVEIKLVELTNQLKKAKGDEKQPIKEVIQKYEVQQKALLTKTAVKAAKSLKKNESQLKVEETIIYAVNSKNEIVLDNVEPQLKNKINIPSMQSPNRRRSKRNEKPKDTEVLKKDGNSTTIVLNPYSPSKKPTDTIKKSPTKRKNVETGADDQGKQTRKPTWSSTSLAEKLRTNTFQNTKENGQGNDQNNEKSNETGKEQKESESEIRVRFQFKAQTFGPSGAKTHGLILKELLYQMIQVAKTIDKTIGLKPWRNDSKMPTLNGNEIMFQNNDSIEKYIDIPDMTENLINGRQYYRNGLRLKTKMSIYEFTERWSNIKYLEKDELILKRWRPLKAAEMQSSHVAYPIGYFAATSERGDYETILNSISEDTGTNTEVSFQFVDQAGVSGKMWRYAREQAEASFPNPHSKEHKRVKFSYAPSALVVYVSDEKMIKDARRKLITKYGKLQEKQWPLMADGSKMRFIPIMMGKIKNKDVYEHLYQHLALQSVSKAGEVKLDLDMWDLKTKKDYLHGSTMEEVIHGITSNTRIGIPIVKHICKKWSSDPSKINYQIAVAPSMLNEAQNMLKIIRAELIKKFKTTAVQKHFVSPYGRNYQYNSARRDEYDPDIETFIMDSTTGDSYSQVLVEGLVMENTGIVKNTSNAKVESPPKSMLFKEGHKKSEKEENSDTEMENVEKEITSIDHMSLITGLTRKSVGGDKANWEEITMANDNEDIIPATKAQIDKLQTTISYCNITLFEIETWKTENEPAYSEAVVKHGNKEYEILSEIINGVLDKRKVVQDEQNEINNFGAMVTNEDKNEISVMAALANQQDLTNLKIVSQPSQSTPKSSTSAGREG